VVGASAAMWGVGEQTSLRVWEKKPGAGCCSLQGGHEGPRNQRYKRSEVEKAESHCEERE